jgi:ribonuclease Z
MVIREIERQATQAWDSGEHAMAAWDFMRVTIPVAEDMGYGRGFDSGEDELGEIKTEEVIDMDFDYRSVSASGSAAWSTTTTTTNTERQWEGKRRRR